MKIPEIPHGILQAITKGMNEQLISLASNLFIEVTSTSHRWLALAFAKSAATPLGLILRPYEVPSHREERLLQRGSIHFRNTPPSDLKYLTREDLYALAEERLAEIFPTGALFIPIPSLTSSGASLGGISAGAIFLETDQRTALDAMAVTLAQTASSIALARLDMAEADRRISESHLLTFSRALLSAHTRRQACALTLEYLNDVIPYQSGVLYLLDPDPGRNEYLLYGASRNENADALYRSFYPREDLGFTWKVAIEQRPRAGSLADVPTDAKRSNDTALEHLRRVHDAWAVVPFTFRGRTRAVAHIEGVNLGDGAAGADLEVMRRLAERVGALLEHAVETCYESAYPPLQLLERLSRTRRAVGQPRRTGFEDLVRHLFGTIDEAQEVLVTRKPEVPQIDGLFVVRDKGRIVVVEAKAPDEEDANIGVEAIRQLMHQMESMGASLGILVSLGRFSSRSASTVTRDHLIIVLDGRQIERFCVLSPSDRRVELSKWLNSEKKGVWRAEIG